MTESRDRSMGLPVIDLAALERASSEDERERLHRAARDLGAFALTGHGVDSRVSDSLLRECRRFFALPQNERDAIDMVHSPYFRGYSAPGTEHTGGRPDLREQFDVGPEEQPRTIATGDPHWLRLHGPNLWPASLPELRASALGWMESARAISQRLIEAILQTAGLPHDSLSAGFSGTPHERLKIIRYPQAGAQLLQGVGEHSDSGFITVIVDDGSPGLEVGSGAGYLDATALPGALIVILGRALHEATAGATHAVRHRVVSPATSRDRISVAYFLNPRLDYGRYGDEALRVVLRSHPRTAQMYFADLLSTR